MDNEKENIPSSDDTSTCVTFFAVISNAKAEIFVRGLSSAIIVRTMAELVIFVIYKLVSLGTVALRADTLTSIICRR